MDVVRALLALADHGKNSGIYNMGTGVARSFQDLVTATFTAMKKPVKINYIDMPVEIRNQYQYFTQANMSKFSDLLPDFKFMSLEESVHHYVTEYLMKPIRYTDPN
jgi:ADP-L-glycero-D-manno-heptose 6-epimerase